MGVVGWYHQWLDRTIEGARTQPFPETEIDERAEREMEQFADLSGPEAVQRFHASAVEYVERTTTYWDLIYPYPFGVVTTGLHCGVVATEWQLHAWDLATSPAIAFRPSDPRSLFIAAGACIAAAEGGIKGAVLARVVPLASRRAPWKTLLPDTARNPLELLFLQLADDELGLQACNSKFRAPNLENGRRNPSSVRSLRHSPIGVVIPITGHDARFGEDYEAEAFLPQDLPTQIDLPGSVWMTVSQAAAELGRLDAAAQLIPNPQLVARVATRREAIGTSALEGTFAGLPELFAAETQPEHDQDGHIPPNVREVMNYTRAADGAFDWINDRPITLGLLSALQAQIVRGTPSDGPDAGSIRTTQVFIGAKHRRVSEARFVPPPPGDGLLSMCEQWIHWLTDPEPKKHIQLIARLAMAHYQFETLHPFTDGNGRVGRLVSVLQILREGALRSPVLAVSPWLEERADEYRQHLFAVSESGDWAPWIEFFATAVSAEASTGHDRIMRLLSLREEFSDTVRTARPRARIAVEIAEQLIAYPILTVADAHRRHGRSNQANRDAITTLVDLGLLEAYSVGRYDRMYWSPRVFQVIDG